MSKQFYLSLSLVLGLYAAVMTWTLTVHLELEQAWTAELLDQNTHSLEVIGYQKDAMREAGVLLSQQEDYIERLENRLFSLLEITNE